MKRLSIIFICFCGFSLTPLFGQNLSGEALLQKTIKYHDPTNQWPSFNDTLYVTMETPKNLNRDSQIIINLPKETFYVKAKRDTITTEFTVIKDTCTIKFNDRLEVDKATAKVHNLNCDRATLFKNYYTYLYGLPMKLKDEGTIIEEKVERKTFKGNPYLVLKVTYDKAVGSDVWFFYFNPDTYAMDIYQFFKTDKFGKIKPDSGEYILLSETQNINKIKIPKKRAWYYNKDDTYLATDVLKNKN